METLLSKRATQHSEISTLSETWTSTRYELIDYPQLQNCLTVRLHYKGLQEAPMQNAVSKWQLRSSDLGPGYRSIRFVQRTDEENGTASTSFY